MQRSVVIVSIAAVVALALLSNTKEGYTKKKAKKTAKKSKSKKTKPVAKKSKSIAITSSRVQPNKATKGKGKGKAKGKAKSIKDTKKAAKATKSKDKKTKTGLADAAGLDAAGLDAGIDDMSDSEAQPSAPASAQPRVPRNTNTKQRPPVAPAADDTESETSEPESEPETSDDSDNSDSESDVEDMPEAAKEDPAEVDWNWYVAYASFYQKPGLDPQRNVVFFYNAVEQTGKGDAWWLANMKDQRIVLHNPITDKELEVEVLDTCNDQACGGCCTRDAQLGDGILIGLETNTAARFWEGPPRNGNIKWRFA